RLAGGHALLTLRPRATRAPATPQQLRQRHGLSLNEARLARLLATGRDLRSAAQELGITYASARTYRERVFDKTGVHRQAELVRLVLGVQD
ncbi:MAG: LuxR C-terminal-related transcriptional regulator, partial [Ottowia sp.]